MSGILRLESLTKGNTLRQGDLTLLKYRLFDADGDKLDISGKPATVRLMKNDFTLIAYEKEGLTVAPDDTISFNINKILPGGLYHLEVIVDDKYIFPSRADEGKFNVDKSSMGAEITIIENAGIDAVVRKAVDLINVDPSLIIDEDKLVTDIISNTGIGSIEEYHQQFTDVLKELSEDKDYHSLPEIAGARGGFDTLGERLNVEKVRIDNLSTMAEGSTTGDAELIDGRVGADAVTYPNIGEAIRSQVNTLRTNAFSDKGILGATDTLDDNLETGMYFSTGTNQVLDAPPAFSDKTIVVEISRFNEAYAIQKVYDYEDVSESYTRRYYYWGDPRTTSWRADRDDEYRGLINATTNIDAQSLEDGLYWVNDINSRPTNSPDAFIGKPFLLRQEKFHEKFYSLQTAYELENPSNMYMRKLYYYTNEHTVWSKVGEASNGALLGKKLLTLGDSITFGATSSNHYQDKIADITGAEVINAGYSGAKYALIAGHEPWNEFSFYQRTIDYDLTDIEYIFVMYGTNDFGNHVPIGTMDSDEYTVKGALVKGLTNLFTKKPNLKIFFSTSIFRATYDGTDIVDLDTKTNDLGLTIHDYSQAVLEVCEKFRIPVFDAQKECGINQLNHHVYLSDKLHPNNSGNDLIGTRFGNFINRHT